MFESLTGSLGAVLEKLRGKSLITDEDFDLAMRQIRVALLEADVSLPIAKEFINSVKEKVIGEKVVKNVSPAQMIIKIVQDKLVEILGSETSELQVNVKPPAVIMMVGLQGAGKTTTTAKLALKLKKSKKVLTASLDVYRPAAQKQLEVLTKQIDVASLPIDEMLMPLEIAKKALKLARDQNYDVLILDTAGRLHINQEMMAELQSIKKLVAPSEIILTADAMMGQDAVNVAKAFNDELAITGIILTRVDGDARGGAALSMKMTANCPIKFLANGEKLGDLEEFHPDRVAQRILSMGDIVSLVEKATEMVGQEEIDKLQKKVKKGSFDLNDLLSQMKALKKMGGLAGVMKFIPNIGGIKQQLESAGDDGRMTKYVAIINSMTARERTHPKLLNGSRRVRVAKGAGVQVHDINLLLKHYNQMSSMVSKFSKLDHDKMKESDLVNLLKKSKNLKKSKK